MSLESFAQALAVDLISPGSVGTIKSAVDMLLTCRYGVLVSSSLHVSLFMLLSALVLTIFNQSVDEGRSANTFSQKWTDVYKVNLGLSYVLVATYLIQTFVLLAGQRMSAGNAATQGEHDAAAAVLADLAMHSSTCAFFCAAYTAYNMLYLAFGDVACIGYFALCARLCTCTKG